MMKALFREQTGLVLPTVVGMIAIISILAFTAVFMIDSQALMGARYAGGELALHFAETGLNRYLWHLNKDSRYYLKTSYTGDEIEPGLVYPYGDGFYYIEVDPPSTAEPVVTIRSMGWREPDNRVTVEAKVSKRQFVQNIYVTNSEVTPSGQDVWWITGDVVNGPVHTNGRFHFNGAPVFQSRVTYSGAAPLYATGSAPVFAVTGDPSLTAQLAFPPSNAQLKTQAQLNGYYFDGRISIWLKGDKMDIRGWNKAGNQYNPVHLVNRPLPPNGVVYVDGGTGKFEHTAGNVFISGTLNGRLTVAAANDIFITWKDPTDPSFNTAQQTGGLMYANADFTPGENLTDDMLGLVAGRYVRILHRDWPGFLINNTYQSVNNSAPDNITIHAAVFALDWAFEFENYASGPPRGTITLTGSITQRYRGAVGTFSSGTGQRLSGYLKNYNYDPRMSYDTPPHFLEPLNAGWEILSWQQVPNPAIPGE